MEDLVILTTFQARLILLRLLFLHKQVPAQDCDGTTLEGAELHECRGCMCETIILIAVLNKRKINGTHSMVLKSKEAL